jgi:hypothetical protein
MHLRKQADQPRQPREKYNPRANSKQTKLCPQCGGFKHYNGITCRDCLCKNRRPPEDNEIYMLDGVRCRRIPLTQNQYTIVDANEYGRLMHWFWFAHKRVTRKGTLFYAFRGVAESKTHKVQMISMTSEVLRVEPKTKIDHKDRNPLNNTKSNLRICTHKENARNASVRSDNTSGYKGVSYHKLINKWAAQIFYNHKQHNLGFFKNKIEAARAYNKEAKRVFGEFAVLNKV